MDFIKAKTGLTSKNGEFRLLYIVTVSQFEAWTQKSDTHFQAWIEQSGFKSKAGGFLLLPKNDGSVAAALLIISENSYSSVNNADMPPPHNWAGIWEMAIAAEKCPPGIWKMDFVSENVDNRAFLLGWGLAQYRFDFPDIYRNEPDQNESKSALLYAAETAELAEAIAMINAISICRDLINLPANYLNTQKLADISSQIASEFSADITLYSGKELAEHAPAIDVVGRAAETPPCLIDFKWGTTGPKITLIGKGITFDTGGLDLKPSKAMEIMKKDMGGAAHALGLAYAIMQTKLPVQLRVLIPAAENSVSDKSMRPLDIIDTAAGIPVEVGNTDAEGRLVLADALHHAKQDNPDFVIDFATLTGAARVALGTECPALFCNKSETAQHLMQFGEATDDPMWQLPLFAPYERYLKTGTSAISSTGQSGYGGAITAALFLQKFIGKTLNWAHIDVMAWNLSSRPGRPKGGEAMGLRASYHYIAELAKNH
ncbi:leucyl aminopeptidase family protein [Alphaproteobacteria bacterium]|nr:leucyl aminopeptidase family protein [Alphaproteobacteria bacterium]